MYDKLAERKNKINTLNNEIKYDNLKHYFKIKDKTSKSFNCFNCSLGLKER